jgi:hypothetical protein
MYETELIATAPAQILSRRRRGDGTQGQRGKKSCLREFLRGGAEAQAKLHTTTERAIDVD